MLNISMKSNRGRGRKRWLPALAASFALVWGLGLAEPTPAFAQEDPAATGDDEANDKTPVYAYVVTGLLGGLCMFVICKSARR